MDLMAYNQLIKDIFFSFQVGGFFLGVEYGF